MLPMQDDRVSIPPEGLLRGGEFIVADVNKGNTGGEVTLYLKRLVVPRLVGAPLVLAAPAVGRPRLARSEAPKAGPSEQLWPYLRRLGLVPPKPPPAPHACRLRQGAILGMTVTPTRANLLT